MLLANQLLYKVLFICLFSLTCSSMSQSHAQRSALNENLNQGNHQVGFQTHFIQDHSRTSVAYTDWNGKIYPHQPTEGRQVQLNVWYPAAVSADDTCLAFSHYVNLTAQQTDFSPLTQEKIDFANSQYVEKTNMLGGNGAFTLEGLDMLRKLPTTAYLNASKKGGKFPLVLFPNGGSPAFQSIMCEQIASHGYVVAAFVIKGANASVIDISVQGMQTAVDDISFVVQALLEMEQVDPAHVCLMGNAINSSHVAAYQASHQTAECLISLEGGFLSNFEQNLLKKLPYYSPENLSVPILAIYAPHPHVDPIHIFPLKHAKRYFFNFPEMTEFHFLNYGVFNSLVEGIIGEHEGDVQGGYQTASQLVVRFLDAQLKEVRAQMDLLEKGITEEFATHIDTFFIRDALPLAPTSTALKDQFTRHGFAYIDSVYQAMKAQNPAPFSMAFYRAMKDYLAWKKDPAFESRYQLFLLAYDSYPTSAEVNYYLAYFAMEAKHKEKAIFHNRKATELLTESPDEDLTVKRKELMLKYLKQDLEALQANE